MKIILITLIVIGTMTFTGEVYGHSGGHGKSHAHKKVKIPKKRTQKIGVSQIERLVKKKKLDSSWLSASYDTSERKLFNGREEWVVTFKNDKGVKGKKLYIFLSLSGDFIAANFSGK